MSTRTRLPFPMRALAGAASTAALLASAAHAQNTDIVEPGEPLATAAVDAEDRRLNEIVVQATRREGVTVQDVPVAVTAFDAALLDDTDFEAVGDLEQLSPSIGITQTESASSGTSISIRGIGTGSNNPGFEPAVGIFIDNVYRTRTGIALSELTELAGVEVLRGPQGTLFGRNTSAGVVSITSAMPQQEGARYAEVTFTDFQGSEIAAGATGGIGGGWAARIDGKIRERDGYIQDVNTDRTFNDIDRWVLRGQLAYEGDNSDFRFIVDGSDAKESCCVGLIAVQGPLAAAVNGGAAIGSRDATGAPTGAVPPGSIGFVNTPPSEFRTAISPNRDYLEDINDLGFSGEFNTEYNGMNFTSITAYRTWDAERNQDIDFSGLDRAYRDGTEITDETFTQEIRLQGDYGNIDWLVGGFYLNQTLTYSDTIRFGTQADLYTDLVANGATGGVGQLFGSLDPTGTQIFSLLGNFNALTGTVAPVGPANPAAGLFPIFIPGTPEGAGQQRDFYETDTNAIALFTHNEIALSDAWSATVGLRYNYEEKELAYDLNSFVPGCDFLAATPGAAQALGGLSLLVCNPAVNSEFNGIDSDSREESEITGTAKLAYEFLDGNLAYASYSRGFKSGGYNIDRSGFDSVLFGGNGAQPSDLEFEGETVDAFELGFKSSFLDGGVTLNAALFYQDVTDFQENIFTGVNFRVVNTDVESYGLEVDLGASPIDGLVIQTGFLYNEASRKDDIAVPDGAGGFDVVAESGVQLSNTPEIVLTGAGTYTFPITEYFEGIAHVNFRYNDETFLVADPRIREATANDAYALVGARLGLGGNDGQWEVSVFGENITGEDYGLSAFGIPEQTGNVAIYPGFPEFYGLELRVNF